MTMKNLFAICAAGERFKLHEWLENNEDQTLLTLENTDGKSLVEVASLFGHVGILEEMFQIGVNLDGVSKRGYSLAHWAAVWGNLDVVKYLLEIDVNVLRKNFHGETARDIAVRYGHDEFALVVERAEMVGALKIRATEYKGTINDPEKNMGRFSKEDKTQGNKYCDDKLSWLDQNGDFASIEQLKSKSLELEQQMKSIMLKLND